MAVEVSCPKCSRKLRVRESDAGRKGKCGCGEVFQIPALAVDEPPDVAALAAAAFDPFDDVRPAQGPTPKKEYKVLTQKDKWFAGKFDPERLEQAINAYAAQGWAVRSMATASIPGFGGNREEIIVLLER